MVPQRRNTARPQAPIEHWVADALQAVEYPLPGKKIPKSVIRKLHPWLRDFVGMTSADAAKVTAARWSGLSDRMLIQIRDYLLGFPPQSIVVGESEAVLMVSRASKDKTFDKHWFIAPPPDLRELRNALRRFGFQESALIADFMAAFGGLREELPGVSGCFPAIQQWERFDSQWMRAMWDQPLASNLVAWRGAVIFYVSLNGDVLLLRRDQALAWWDHEMNEIRPLSPHFPDDFPHFGM